MKREPRDRGEMLEGTLEDDNLSSASALMTPALKEEDLLSEDGLGPSSSLGPSPPHSLSPEGGRRGRVGPQHETFPPLKAFVFQHPDSAIPGDSVAHTDLNESYGSADRLMCILCSCCQLHHHHTCRANTPTAAPRVATTADTTFASSSRGAPPTPAAMTTLMVPQLACSSFVPRRGISNEDPLQQPHSLQQHHLQQQPPQNLLHHQHQSSLPVSPTVVTPYVCGKMFHVSNFAPSCCLAVGHHHQGLCPGSLGRNGSGFEGETRCPHVVHSCQHRCPNYLQVPPMMRLDSVSPCSDVSSRIHISGGRVVEVTSDGGGGGGGGDDDGGGGGGEGLWGSDSKVAFAFTSKNPFNPFNPFNDHPNLPLSTSNHGSCRSTATTPLIPSLPPTLTTSTTSTTTNPFITSRSTNPFVTSRTTVVPPQTTNTSPSSSSSSTVIDDVVDGRITSPSPSAAAVWTVEDDHRVLERTRRAVRECGWYMSDLSHSEALALLRGSKPGTFILRDSSDPRYLYSFTVQTAKEPTSVRVQYSHGKFRLDCATNASTSMPSFGSLMGLVDYYTRVTEQNDLRKQHVWIDASGKKFAPIEFRRPLRRSVPSLQHMCRLAFHKGPGASQPPPEGELPVTIMHYLKEYPHRN